MFSSVPLIGTSWILEEKLVVYSLSDLFFSPFNVAMHVSGLFFA